MDKEQKGQNHMTLRTLSIFENNSHFAFIYKKTEKLVTAVYMITNFIKDTEPLKWRIREICLDLLSLNMSFNTVSLSERKDLLRQYQAHSITIISLSEIAHHSGLISEMNFSILKREFEALVAIISNDENKKANEETIMIDREFFTVAKDAPEVSNNPNYANQAAGQNPVSYKTPFNTEGPAMGAPMNTPNAPINTPVSKAYTEKTLNDFRNKHINTHPAIHQNTRPQPVNTGSSNNNRKDSIIKLLGKKSGLTVKDFIEVIPNVSEKTIQRELLALVANGVLKKEGERRWSTYSLAVS